MNWTLFEKELNRELKELELMKINHLMDMLDLDIHMDQNRLIQMYTTKTDKWKHIGLLAAFQQKREFVEKVATYLYKQLQNYKLKVRLLPIQIQKETIEKLEAIHHNSQTN